MKKEKKRQIKVNKIKDLISLFYLMRVFSFPVFNAIIRSWKWFYGKYNRSNFN